MVSLWWWAMVPHQTKLNRVLKCANVKVCTRDLRKKKLFSKSKPKFTWDEPQDRWYRIDQMLLFFESSGYFWVWDLVNKERIHRKYQGVNIPKELEFLGNLPPGKYNSSNILLPHWCYLPETVLSSFSKLKVFCSNSVEFKTFSLFSSSGTSEEFCEIVIWPNFFKSSAVAGTNIFLE